MNRLYRFGIFGLGVFALSCVWKTAPGHIGLALSLPAALVAVWQDRRRFWDAANLLAVVLAVWLCVRYLLQTWGGLAEAGLVKPTDVFIDWLWPLLFAPLAMLPCQDRLRRLKNLWLLAMLGFSFGIGAYLWQRGLDVLWSGERLGFHLDRPLGVGLYAGSFALVLIATARQWWAVTGAWRWPTRMAGVVLVALNLQVLLSTQNRSTYLALAVVGVGAVAVAGWQTLQGRPWLRLPPSLGAVGALIAAVLLSGNFHLVQQRIDAEAAVIQTVFDDGLEAAPAASATVRLRLWQYAWQRFADAPSIGHGFGDVKEIIERDLRPRAALSEGERYDHLHNSYLQTLWSQGAIGSALWLALAWVLVRDAMRAARGQPQCRAMLPAMWAVLTFTAVWAMFDYRLSHPDMRFFSILLLLSLRLLGMCRAQEKEQ